MLWPLNGIIRITGLWQHLACGLSAPKIELLLLNICLVTLGWQGSVKSVKAMAFSSSHVWMWESDHKEGWVLKDWCFWIVVLEKTLESPLNCKEIKPVHPKGNQPWIFIGRTYAEAPVLWPPDVKSRLTRKDPVAGKDWRQEEKVMTEDEMVGWHHRLDGHAFEQALGVDDGQGSLVCCSPWGCRVGHD